MYRRKFLTNGVPYRIESFANEFFLEWEIDNTNSIEFLNNKYRIVSFNDGHLIINDVKAKALGNFKKFATEYHKIRYYIPLTSILYAKIDICNNNKKDAVISVDFNSKEEADNFEIPSWFGAELVPELMVKQKIKSK